MSWYLASNESPAPFGFVIQARLVADIRLFAEKKRIGCKSAQSSPGGISLVDNSLSPEANQFLESLSEEAIQDCWLRTHPNEEVMLRMPEQMNLQVQPFAHAMSLYATVYYLSSQGEVTVCSDLRSILNEIRHLIKDTSDPVVMEVGKYDLHFIRALMERIRELKAVEVPAPPPETHHG